MLNILQSTYIFQQQKITYKLIYFIGATRQRALKKKCKIIHGEEK